MKMLAILLAPLIIIISACGQNAVRESNNSTFSNQSTGDLTVNISDLEIKDAKIASGKNIECGKIESNARLFLVFSYKVSWRFVNFTRESPTYYAHIDLIGNNGAYNPEIKPNKISMEMKDYKPGLILNGEKNQLISHELDYGSICTIKETKKPIPGDANHVNVETTHTMTIPGNGKFSLTVSINGQKLSKDFIVH